MSLTSPTRPDGPIPGANYTSDTRNWPWHRPPDITNMDDCLDYVVETLTETDAGMRYMSIIEAGMPLTSITDIIVTLGIGRGKWTPDFALLVAGPVTRILEIMAKSYNIDYEIGLEEESDYRSSVYYEALAEDSGALKEPEEDPSEMPEAEEEDKTEAGFMSQSSSEEQLAMLGYGDEQLEEVEESKNE